MGIASVRLYTYHDDVIKWKHFPRYRPFVRGIYRSPVNSPHKGQWRGASFLSLMCAWINVWVKHRETGDLRRHRAYYNVTVMIAHFHNDNDNFPTHWFLLSRELLFCEDYPLMSIGPPPQEGSYVETVSSHHALIDSRNNLLRTHGTRIVHKIVE